MSSLTTSQVNTANGATPLTLGTGNTSGPAIVVTGGTDIALKANSSANVFIANSSGIRANAAVTVANTLNVIGVTTLNSLSVSNGSFTGVTTFVNATANVVTVISNTLTLGTSSIATSGHSRLPNGLLLQWGTVTSNSSSGSITFPIAFSVAPYSLSLTGSDLSVASYAYVTTSSATTATVRSTSTATPASNVYFYMAIGV